MANGMVWLVLKDVLTISKLVDCADDVLFNKVLDNLYRYHILHNAMPNESVSNYALRS